MNSMELLLARADMYSEILGTGTISTNTITTIKNNMQIDPAYANKPSFIAYYILRSIENAFVNSKGETPMDVILEKYSAVLDIISANVYPVSKQFFLRVMQYYLMRTGGYNTEDYIPVLSDAISAMDKIDSKRIKIEAVQPLLTFYLASPVKYIEQIRTLSNVLRELNTNISEDEDILLYQGV